LYFQYGRRKTISPYRHSIKLVKNTDHKPQLEMDSGIDGLFGLRIPHSRTNSRSPSRGRAQKRSASSKPNSAVTGDSLIKNHAKLVTTSALDRDAADPVKVAAKSKESQAVLNPLHKSVEKTRKEFLRATNIVSSDPLCGKKGSSRPSTARFANTDVLEAPHRERSTIWIDISGAPASGKTTLAHLLSLIMPSVTRVVVIHQDDYQKPRHLLVPGDPADIEQDGENDQSVDTNGIVRLCRYVDRNGIFPSNFRTQHQDDAERAIALALVDRAHIEGLRALLLRSTAFESIKIVIIVEGPFLYHDPDLYDALDVRYFLRARLSTARSRWLTRVEHRDPKINNDLFWLSPDYFNRVIWRLYLKEYSLLFQEDAADEVDFM